MIPGKYKGTNKDKLFLIGAHYDTVRTTNHGVDDNGSGVAAMLQAAKHLSTGERDDATPYLFFTGLRSNEPVLNTVLTFISPEYFLEIQENNVNAL